MNANITKKVHNFCICQLVEFNRGSLIDSPDLEVKDGEVLGKGKE
jgi:hypothetical protein